MSATDADSGANGDIVFAIQNVSNNGAAKFSIQPGSVAGRATISCVGSVADGEIYVIMVRATDQGQPISERRYTKKHSTKYIKHNWNIYSAYCLFKLKKICCYR